METENWNVNRKTLKWPSILEMAYNLQMQTYLKHVVPNEEKTSWKAYVHRHTISEIRRIWKTLPEEYAENLIENMPRRCQ